MSQLITVISNENPCSSEFVSFEKLDNLDKTAVAILSQAQGIKGGVWISSIPDEILENAKECLVQGNSVVSTDLGSLIEGLMNKNCKGIAVFFSHFFNDLPTTNNKEKFYNLIQQQVISDSDMGIEIYGLFINQ